MNVNYIFNSKETYLAARAAWKANYAQLTLDIRAARAAYNKAQSEASKVPMYNNHGPYWAAQKLIDTTRDARQALRREANNAIAELVEMKEEAARQWAENQVGLHA